MERHELDAMRRSFAVSRGLTESDCEQLLLACDRLLAERARIERILHELGPAWGGARRALNELTKVLRAR